MDEKQRILTAIEALKPDKPACWRRDARYLAMKLAKYDDPYGKHESRGNEMTGRLAHSADSPSYDSMDDDSHP